MSSKIDFDTAFQRLLTDYAEQKKDTPRGDPRGMTNTDAKIKKLVKLSKKTSNLVDQYLETHSTIETRQYLCSFGDNKECMPDPLRNMLVLHPITSSNVDFDVAFRALLSEYEELTKGTPKGDSRGMTDVNAKFVELVKLSRKASGLVDRFLEAHSKEETEEYLSALIGNKKHVHEAFSNMLVAHSVRVEEQSTADQAGV